MNEPSSAAVGVIGGSGLYSLFDDAFSKRIDTPYGEPSDEVTIGAMAGRDVAFLPRHGPGHAFPAHRVNFRANLWALRETGVRQVIGVGAVGSLTAAIPPGSLVVPDQLVDRTSGREQTFFDGPLLYHAPFADPYCPIGSAAAARAAETAGWPAVAGGTQVVIQGPRFSSRAESRWYASQGWSIVGMTALPEVALARELGMCYVPLCLVTDLDAGIEAGTGVTQAQVLEAFKANIGRVRDVLAGLVAILPEPQECECAAGAPELD